MAKYPVAITDNETGARLVFKNIGNAEGSIIATIIASHMSRKLVADATQVWPGIRIHIIDIVHPPGISISQHIERQKYAVAATLATKARTHAAMNSADCALATHSRDFSFRGWTVIDVLDCSRAATVSYALWYLS